MPRRTISPRLSALLAPAMLITLLPSAATAAPIPLDDHSYRSFNSSWHYSLARPPIIEPLDVHNLSIQLSNRSYFSDDTSMVSNRLLLLFADSINFRSLDFNFRIRADYPGGRVKDAGWTSERAGEANNPGFVYDPDRIVAHFTPSERFRFGFGKDRYNWGPLELGGLLLSDYNRGFTGVYQQYALGGFVLRGLTAQLDSRAIDDNGIIIMDDSWGADPAGNSIMHRYLSVSRLEYYKPAYGAAAGQGILYAGRNRSFELQYFFPFYIFHYGQMTDDHSYKNNGHNTFGSLDGYVKIYKLPLEAYGELLIDDFQGHSDEKSQSVQNAVSWMAGLRLKDAGAWYGFAEGGKISTYTYNHIAWQMRYRINDCFIGSPLGPDQQLVWGKFGRIFPIASDTLNADLNFWLRRSGERHGRDTMYAITDFYDTRNDPQPYGTVENELSFWASAAYRKFSVNAELRGGMTMYKNRGNEKSRTKSYPFFGIFLSSGLSSSAKQ